ncbi:hypothetical protein GUJ93_ZPchr0012g21703 [Zizania palustris]|uniref:Uncharacterized protein n=1 Tax=Zizania palustris TaxID=103762 RepID=A0A8J5WPS0_ZIZPA|nr:hypothetical protein GUJ93_ZPchr0012g21703 [Zizania palustris]
MKYWAHSTDHTAHEPLALVYIKPASLSQRTLIPSRAATPRLPSTRRNPRDLIPSRVSHGGGGVTRRRCDPSKFTSGADLTVLAAMDSRQGVVLRITPQGASLWPSYQHLGLV